MPIRCLLFVTALALADTLPAQFVPALLENRSYWGDGKSEIDFYQAEVPREGQNLQCEPIMIFTPVFVDPTTLAPLSDNKQAGAVPGIRMTYSTGIERGLTNEIRSIESLWRMDSMSLARLAFAGTDVFGNVSKSIREKRDGTGAVWMYQCDGYTGRTDSQSIPLGAKTVVAYEELPLRVRTLDFSRPSGEFDVELAPSLVSPEKEAGERKPAKITWKAGERTIDVQVQHAAGKDSFTLDSNFPFLLRDWRTADGAHWKMKNSIRADYTKYLKKGDRERAFKDPMLRHPD